MLCNFRKPGAMQLITHAYINTKYNNALNLFYNAFIHIILNNIVIKLSTS